jgi:hypothetical protein
MAYARRHCITDSQWRVLLLKYTTLMTPEEFKQHCKSKGWTFRALAGRWEKSETWISKVANNPEREMLWDDAARGLEDLTKSKGQGAKKAG